MTFGFGLGLIKGGGAGGLPAFAANFIGGSLPTGSTFSRGTIGTLYNSSGLLQMAPSNLLGYSQNLANGWTTLNCTLSASTVYGPDGTTLLSLITSTSAGGDRIQQTTTITAGITYTLSAYLAVGSSIYGGLVAAGATSAGATYNLTGAGAVVSTAGVNAVSATIQSVGNGLYRCSLTYTAASTGSAICGFGASDGSTYAFSIYPSSASGSISGGFVQLEQSPTATTYTPTTSAAVYGPRFDFDPNNVLQQNLLTYSEQLTNVAYSTTSATTVANSFISPTGTLTATSLIEAATASISPRLNPTAQTFIAGQKFNISVYARSITSGRYLAFAGLGIAAAGEVPVFNLDAGTVSTAGTSVVCKSATIIAVGNGWYRCSMSIVPANTSTFVVQLTNSPTGGAGAAPSYNGDGVSGLYLWGLQNSDSSAILPYTATTTAAITQCAPKGLLIEETRTNSLLQSEDFNTTWTTASSTVATNSTTAPDGNTTADKVTSLAATALTGVQGALTGTAVAWTASVYAKANGAQYLQLVWQTPINTTDYANFDLLGGTVTAGTNTSSSIQYVGNGWYRCTITSTLIAANGAVYIDMVDTSAATRGAAFTGDGTKGIYLWGAQAEIGAFATSYIPTTSATVTRNFDSLRITSIPWFNASAGTFVAQADNLSIAGTQQAICAFSAGAVYSTGNGFLLRSKTTGIVDTGGNTSSVAATGTITANVPYKAASTYQGVNMAVTLNGVTPTTATTNDFTGSGTTTLILGALTTAFVQGMSGHIQSFSYFNYALTNTQLQQITT
jgi:hypothetical protein